ncbi:MAG: DUF6443 domain-containing protein [Prolixibacteraceae bacterium]|nr:DUF6443 domain-containing protein [Prolixibacteraceae bacterium]
MKHTPLLIIIIGFCMAALPAQGQNQKAPLSAVVQTKLIVFDTIVYSQQAADFTAIDTIIVAGSGHNVTFQDSTMVNLLAGRAIIFKAGFKADSGSHVRARILTDHLEVTPADIKVNADTTQQLVGGMDGYNYIREYTYSNGNSPSEANANHVNIDIQYFDGLGRPSETVGLNASPTGKDIIALQTYDNFGRADKTYLPLTMQDNHGAFMEQSWVNTNLPSFLLTNYEIPYTDKYYGFSRPAYEPSPLNRVTEQGAPGEDWQPGAHADGYSYQTNTSAVSSYQYTGSTYSSISYPAGTLYVTQTTDGDGKQTRVYTDKLGRTVMEEAYGVLDTRLQTKYCYDKFGLKRCVMQPMASSPVDSGNCFYYNWDARQRLTEKKVPGSEWVYMIYDPRDRLVLTSDGNSREENSIWDKYYYTIYDDFNRPIEKGWVTTTFTRDSLVNIYKGTTDRFRAESAYKYTEKFFYDTHAAVYDSCMFSPIAGLVSSADTAVSSKGFLTGKVTKTYYPDGYISVNEKYEAYYYDKYGRMLQTVTENFIGGTDRITNKYMDESIASSPIVQTRQTHSPNTINIFYTYDHRDRLLNTEYSVDGYIGQNEPRTIVSANVYNEAGLLKAKYLHSQGGLAFMQKIDYKYNIRGWLTAINEPSSEFSEGDRFGMRLWYNKKPDDSEGYFNGNIAATAWSTPNYKNLQYAYTYNKLNRLTQAKFWGEGFRDTTNYFKVNYSYDANGNILRLERYGLDDSPRLDNITYGYYDNTNVLKYSSDPNGDAPYIDDFIGTYSGTGVYYEYDPNGNMTRDDYKGLAVEYNDLNLPEELDFGSNNKILYFYNSTGEKMLRAIDSDSVADMNTYYFGPFVHEGTDGSSSSLKYIITPEGRILNKGTDTSPIWDWEYYLKDHLGNVRVVIAPTEDAGYSAVQQETHYYPYGMRISQLSNSANSTNDWLFSGKQLESNFGLGWYSFGGRNNYDPALIIWRSIDPMAEVSRRWSPYTYCYNNPLRYIDPDGMLIDDYFNMEGQYLGTDEATTDYVKIINQNDWDENKTITNEGVETIDHTTGKNLSTNITETTLKGNAVENIAVHYDSQIEGIQRNEKTQIDAKQLSNKKTLMQSEKGGGIVLFGKKITNPAPKIVVNTQDGKVHSELNTASNIKNTLVHEHDHQVSPTMSEPKKELRAISTQKSHSTYKRTTPSYKKIVDDYEKYYKNK